jgi:hypothetical protein
MFEVVNSVDTVPSTALNRVLRRVNGCISIEEVRDGKEKSGKLVTENGDGERWEGAAEHSCLAPAWERG